MTGGAVYDFDAYRAALSGDWYDDDPLLHRLLDRHAPDADRGRLERFGQRAAGELRELAEASARPEHAPRLRHRDAYDRRVDAIELPASTRAALRIAHGEEGLGTVRGDAFTHYAMIYLLAQNGEAGVACSLACTDGLVRALESGDPGSPHRVALAAVRESSGEAYAHAAQFVTEIQGGSDVPANRARAVPDGAAYRIHGQKWFCSNINADWFLVTARATGGDGHEPGDAGGGEEGSAGPLGLFLVPALVDGHRNGYRIDRLKDKLGTRELATAEVRFDGARGWPVVPPDRGLSHLLRHVLTPSRFACVLFVAGALRRAERITREYARFREAFGQPIARYPLVRRTLESIADGRRASLVAAFEILRLWQGAEAGGFRGRDTADFRVLLSLAKPVLTHMATARLHEAMMVLGANGIEERFSPLPRLYRDSVIMETWEGPHNVLFTQAVRDLRRFDIQPGPFLERVTGRPQPELAARIRSALEPPDEGDAAVALAELAPAIIAATSRDPENHGPTPARPLAS